MNDLIIFGAQWCGPCRASKPQQDPFLESHPGVGITNVDVDEQQDMVADYKVRSVPTVVALDLHGNEVGRHVGAYSKTTLERLAGVGAVD